MDESDFKTELDLFDKYVKIKDTGDGENIILNLIENQFLPRKGLTEAKLWVDAVQDKYLKQSVKDNIRY